MASYAFSVIGCLLFIVSQNPSALKILFPCCLWSVHFFEFITFWNTKNAMKYVKVQFRWINVSIYLLIIIIDSSVFCQWRKNTDRCWGNLLSSTIIPTFLSCRGWRVFLKSIVARPGCGLGWIRQGSPAFFVSLSVARHGRPLSSSSFPRRPFEGPTLPRPRSSIDRWPTVVDRRLYQALVLFLI